MGMFKYVRESFQQSVSKHSDTFKARLQKWRKQPSIVRVENPTNTVRAHELGYKAKKEFVVVRIRVSKGKRTRPAAALGRKPGKNVKRVSPGFSLQNLAEQRTAVKYPNLKVVNSYLAGMDGTHKYFEVILHNDFIASKPNRPR
ncbi:50S ribosomal protein L15e [Candidatus Micrarchaeota archaeon]|nr:50S ribosomal protein L15e [Candidatus Micrarchaeota archaeon]MBI5177243.1 50S ribosomal protein L15e [Candidatus Micrarchaeota archaeon]